MSYFEQVRLLVAVLPHVAKQTCFALKGGTALNLFIRDLPRLSVDIDLTYLPVSDRATSLAHIESSLQEIANDIANKVPGTKVLPVKNGGTQQVDKLIVDQTNNGQSVASITIEVNPVIRGCVFATEVRQIAPLAQQEYGFAQITTLNFADLYAGKIVAALDRQHPRDLFDIKLLLENEGVNEQTKNAFLVYLLSSDRPMSELLLPRIKEIRPLYDAQFVGMTKTPVAIEDLERARTDLISTIRNALTDQDKQNLLAIKRGDFDWTAFPIQGVTELPAIKWKLHNFDKIDKVKRQQAIAKLSAVLYP